MTTLAEARTELKDRGYSRFPDARLDAWLNQARVRFEDFPVDWPWLQTGLNGVTPLSLGFVRRVLSVYDTLTETALDRTDQDTLITFTETDLTRPGAPRSWYLFQGLAGNVSLLTYPVTSNVSVHYTQYSPLLSSGDSPLIPLPYHTDWIDLAEVNVLRYGEKDIAAAAVLDAVVQARLAEIAVVVAMQDRPVYEDVPMHGGSTDG